MRTAAGSVDARPIRPRSAASARKAKPGKPRASRRFELHLYRQGLSLVAGVDEVGRGCLAGPVLAAAVILPDDAAKLRRISGVQDSKVLKLDDRERLYIQIMKIAVAVGVGLCSHRFIDRYGIAPASRMAMSKAVGKLGVWPDHLLIDALRLPLLNCPQTAIIDGDALCLSIASASIVAKVTRDRLMTIAAAKHPGYGFQNHKGYGTPEHHHALIESGPCSIHRLTFRPAFASCSIGELTSQPLREPQGQSEPTVDSGLRQLPSIAISSSALIVPRASAASPPPV